MPMRARDPGESHRVSTPLELLFDLTFVVGVSAVVSELAHAVAGGHPVEGLIGYFAVFFGIWWAWMNFTWFASAFDCDDAPYRLLTMVQMGGVLVLAAGVQPAFELADFRLAVAGYVIMRIALVAQWLRVAGSVPEYRETALRFAIPIAILQFLWVIRLGFPDPLGRCRRGRPGRAEVAVARPATARAALGKSVVSARRHHRRHEVDEARQAATTCPSPRKARAATLG